MEGLCDLFGLFTIKAISIQVSPRIAIIDIRATGIFLKYHHFEGKFCPDHPDDRVYNNHCG